MTRHMPMPFFVVCRVLPAGRVPNKRRASVEYQEDLECLNLACYCR